MILYVADLLKDAMRLANATEIDETPSSSDMDVMKRMANVMLDGWSAQKLMLRSTTTISFSTVANTASYTVASSGAVITAAAPIRVASAIVTDSTSNDYIVEVVPKDLYDGWTDKNISNGRPEYIAFDSGATQQTVRTGTFYLYPRPDTVYTMKVECECYLTEFVNYTDAITLPPAYYEALIYNLAGRCWRIFNDNKAPIPADLAYIAQKSLNTIHNMNAEQVYCPIDVPGIGGRYNVYTDQGA